MTANSGLAAFYPIVPDVTWLQRIVPLGVKTVQLRLKDAPDGDVRSQIRQSLAVCRAHGCQLIVNDYWRAAIEEGADYIHLGQEDLVEADIPAIKRASLRLGISTHDEAELNAALAAQPDYIALGPIYPTTLKAMRFGPQGLERIAEWKSRIGPLPLVAIGGITLERAQGVMDHGAGSIAVVSDFLTHSEPEKRIDDWLSWARTLAPRR